jgi:predicted dehydrogenase
MHYGAGDAAEDWIGIEMAFASGAQGRVEVFRRIGVGPARAAVWGTEGMAVATDGTHVEVRRNDAHPRSITGLRRPGTLGDEIYDDVAAAIRQGGALRVSALNARDVVEVIELAERSAARGGAPIRVDRR